MFKESDKNTQSDLFGSMSCVLVGKALKVYGDKKGWHNQFRGGKNGALPPNKTDSIATKRA